MGRRVLITGLSTFWGGRLAQELESDSSVDVVVGIDNHGPVVELERTEFVRSDDSYSILSRLLRATQVDTVVHAGLVVDSTLMPDRRLYEKNVIGTMNLLAAASAEGSRVRRLLVKSSALVYGSAPEDPTWFREETTRSRQARTRIERSLLEAEGYVAAFAEDNPSVGVAVLRCANVLGDGLATALSRAISMPAVPTIVGFDPQFQFVEQEDVVRAVRFALDEGLEGTYNVAADGRLPWSEVRAIAGKPPLPLSPLATGLAAFPLTRLGLVALPPEIIDLLRFGRGLDNRKLKMAGFRYSYSTASTVRRFVEETRLRRVVGPTGPAYRYQEDVENFFLHSPAVVRSS